MSCENSSSVDAANTIDIADQKEQQSKTMITLLCEAGSPRNAGQVELTTASGYLEYFCCLNSQDKQTEAKGCCDR